VFNPANLEPTLDAATGELEHYNLYKVTNNVPILLDATSRVRAINDYTADIDKQSYCYQLSWTNRCNVESAKTPTVCSVHLSANGQVLNWTNETPQSSNVLSYEVLAYNEPQVKNPIKQVDVNLNSNWLASLSELPSSLGQRLYFQITTRPQVDINGQSYSNIIEVYRPPVIQVPSVFTPNGDGINDVFTLNGVYIKKVKMSIFDRWGNIIYKTETDNFDPTDPSFGWSGYMPNGELAKEDTYAYKMDIEDSDVTGPKKFVKEGAIVLMR
nr:gliding motility-associated C-terminal domain-containing protein [Pseudarcicella sp.]